MEEDASTNPNMDIEGHIDNGRHEEDEEIKDFDGMDEWVVMDDLNPGDGDHLSNDQGEMSLPERGHNGRRKNVQASSWLETFEKPVGIRLQRGEDHHQDDRRQDNSRNQIHERRSGDLHRRDDRKSKYRDRNERKDQRHDKYYKDHRRSHNGHSRDKKRHDFYSDDNRRRKDFNSQDNRRRDDYHRDSRRRCEDKTHDSSYRDERSDKTIGLDQHIMDRDAEEYPRSYGEKRRRSRSPNDNRHRSQAYPGDQLPMPDRDRSPMYHDDRLPVYTGDRSPMQDRDRSPMYHRDRSPVYTGDRSPMQDIDRSPMYSRHRSPVYPGDRSPMPDRDRSPMYHDDRLPVYPGDQSLMQDRDRSPMYHDDRLPVYTGNRSPIQDRDRSPMYHRDRSPVYTGDRSPIQDRDTSPMYHRDRSPVYTGDRSPIQDRDRSPMYHGDRSPVYTGDQTPIQDRDRSPMYHGDRSPVYTGDRSPIQERDRSPMYHRDRSPVYPGDRSPIQDRDRSPMYLRDRSPVYPGDQSPMPDRDTSPMYHRDRSPVYPGDQSPMPDRDRSLMYPRERSPFDPRGRSPTDPMDISAIYMKDRQPMDSGDYRLPIDSGDHRSLLDPSYIRPSIDFSDQKSMDVGSSEQNSNKRIGIGGVYFDLSSRPDTSKSDEVPFSQLEFKEDMFCPICKVDDTRYSTRFEFHNHWIKIHAKYRNFFPCPIRGCSKTFRAKPKMIEHVLNIHSKEQRFEANFEEILLDELNGPKEESNAKVNPATSTTGSGKKIWETVQAVAAIMKPVGGQQMQPPNVQAVPNQMLPAVGNPSIATIGNPATATFANPLVATSGNPFISAFANPPISSFAHPPISSFANPPISSFANPPISTFSNPPISTFGSPPIAPFGHPQVAVAQGPQPISSSGSYLPNYGPNIYSGAYQSMPIVGRNEIKGNTGSIALTPFQSNQKQIHQAIRPPGENKARPNLGSLPVNLKTNQQTARTMLVGHNVAPNPVTIHPVRPQKNPQSSTVEDGQPTYGLQGSQPSSGHVMKGAHQSPTSIGIPPMPKDHGKKGISYASKKWGEANKVIFEPLMRCPLCKPCEQFATEVDLLEHWKLYHVGTIEKYRCPVKGCRSSITSQRKLQEHYRITHNAGKVEVSTKTSNMLLKAKPELEESPWFRDPLFYVFEPSHDKLFVFKPNTICPVCVVSEVFVDLESFQLHWQSFHSKYHRYFLCSNSDCDVSKTTIEQLKNHYWESHNCGNKSLTRAAVQDLNDCQIKMEPNPFYMDPAPYYLREEKLYHIQFHDDMICPICPQKIPLKTFNIYWTHWITHHKKYIETFTCPFGNCSTCHNTFDQLKNHYIAVHNNNQPNLSNKTIEFLNNALKESKKNIWFSDPGNCTFVHKEDLIQRHRPKDRNIVFTPGTACPICHKKYFKKEKAFWEHWQSVHIQFHKAYVCIFEGCEENKPSLSKLKIHYGLQHCVNEFIPPNIMHQLSSLRQQKVVNPHFIATNGLKYFPKKTTMLKINRA